MLIVIQVEMVVTDIDLHKIKTATVAAFASDVDQVFLIMNKSC